MTNVRVIPAHSLHTPTNPSSEDGQEWQDGDVVRGVAYRTPDGVDRVAHGYLTVVCDGMYSSLRTKLSQPDIKAPSYFVGVILQDCRLPYDNYGHVVLARPSPILFYPISSTEVRCLVDYPGGLVCVCYYFVIVAPPHVHHTGTKLPSTTNGELQAYLKNEVAPQIPAQLQQAFLAAVDTGRIRAMQNKCMAAKPLQQPGALLLGDAFNMRHPLTGRKM